MNAKLIHSDLLPFFYNVTSHVGAGRTNNFEDVMLVEFLMQKVGEFYREHGALRNVLVNGAFDKNTADAIIAFQTVEKRRRPAVVIDGVVSPQQGTSPAYGSAVWSICQLNKYVKDSYKQVWPRLQDLPGCPALLKQKCFEQIVGRETV